MSRERKDDHALGMQTHRRAAGAGCLARAWVVSALRNGVEVRERMVKGEGGGAGCCAGSERATTRRACKRLERGGAGSRTKRRRG